MIDPKWWQACGLEKLHCPWNTSHRFRQTCFLSICYFSSRFSVFFALAVLARNCTPISTLSRAHKQSKVLADDTASSLLWGKAQMPLRMPSTASHVHGAPQEWVQLSDWALYCTSCGAQDLLFEEDSYLSHHWPNFGHPSICSSFLCETTQKVFMQNETHSEKYSERILLGHLMVWEICSIISHLTVL